MIRCWPETLRDFIFPPECSVCQRPLLLQANSSPFSLHCSHCRDSFPVPISNPCEFCGAEVGPHLDASGRCSQCRRESFAFRSVAAYGTYTTTLRDYCYRCKAGHQPLALELAEALWKTRKAWFQAGRWDYVVPVPMHWQMRWKRKRHPNEVFASHLAERLRVKLAPRFLRQIRPITRQATLSATQRKRNVRQAYRALHSRRLRGAHLLLVDDILTTGATAHECAKTLRAAGSGPIDVAVIARSSG